MMASNHICPYHAYHAACDHAYPVLRSVLCALYSESQVITHICFNLICVLSSKSISPYTYLRI